MAKVEIKKGGRWKSVDGRFCCFGGRFPTFGVILLVAGVIWLLNDLKIITVDIPWIPLIIIAIALGIIHNRIFVK